MSPRLPSSAAPEKSGSSRDLALSWESQDAEQTAAALRPAGGGLECRCVGWAPFRARIALGQSDSGPLGRAALGPGIRLRGRPFAADRVGEHARAIRGRSFDDRREFGETPSAGLQRARRRATH